MATGQGVVTGSPIRCAKAMVLSTRAARDGVCPWRGTSVQELVCQLIGNAATC
jgi:hypothetical protein